MSLKYLSGLSLVELLISMLVAAFIFSGVVSIAFTSRTTFRDEQESSFIQENARYAVEIISRDLRLAGSLGCVDTERVKIANARDTDGSGLYGLNAIEGFGAGDIDNIPDVLSDVTSSHSDAIIIRYSEPASENILSRHNKTTRSFELNEPHRLSDGDTAVIVDASCRHAAYFKVESASTTDTLEYEDPCGGEIFSDGDLGITECASLTPNTRRYSRGSAVMRYMSNAYFIEESHILPGMPALKRRALSPSGYRTEELAQGVERMEFQFGVDLDGDSPGDIDVYWDASQFSRSELWAYVTAVRVNLVFRSQGDVFDQAQDAQRFGIDGADRYLRQAVTATVQLRNRYRLENN